MGDGIKLYIKITSKLHQNYIKIVGELIAIVILQRHVPRFSALLFDLCSGHPVPLLSACPWLLKPPAFVHFCGSALIPIFVLEVSNQFILFYPILFYFSLFYPILPYVILKLLFDIPPFVASRAGSRTCERPTFRLRCAGGEQMD